MRGIGLQSGAIDKFGEQDNVASIVDFADIDADLDMSEAVNASLQPFEQGLDCEPRLRALRGRFRA